MQLIRTIEQDEATLVGYGIRVLFLSAQQGLEGNIPRRLAGLGGVIKLHNALFAALEAVIDDPAGYGVFVIDCDSLGGLEVGRKAVAMMGETLRRVPAILISAECREQSFPQDRMAPTLLRAPLSAVSMRVGFEHALRDRLSIRMIGNDYQAA